MRQPGDKEQAGPVLSAGRTCLCCPHYSCSTGPGLPSIESCMSCESWKGLEDAFRLLPWVWKEPPSWQTLAHRPSPLWQRKRSRAHKETEQRNNSASPRFWKCRQLLNGASSFSSTSLKRNPTHSCSEMHSPASFPTVLASRLLTSNPRLL